MTWQPGPGWLFCPADRPERYAKAAAAADVVILDLEDAVAPADKPAAREALRAASLDPETTVVRVNAAGTVDHELDLAALEGTGIRRIMLAKTEGREDLRLLSDLEVVALVETPLGLHRIDDIVTSPAVIGVMWGADDLVAGLGGTSSRRSDGGFRDVARHARSRSLVAAKAFGLLALDSVHMDIPDLDGLAHACEDAVAVGFDATVAIHPSQVAVVRRSYRPSDDRIAWARDLLATAEGNRGVFTFDGRMVDGPIFAQAERIMRLADLIDHD